jgi:hypothetical protein
MLAELRGNRVNELPSEDAAALDSHLHSCPDCHALLRIEEKLDAPLLKAMAAIPVPPGLKAKILTAPRPVRRRAASPPLGHGAAVAAVVTAVASSVDRIEAEDHLRTSNMPIVASTILRHFDEWLSQGVRTKSCRNRSIRTLHPRHSRGPGKRTDALVQVLRRQQSGIRQISCLRDGFRFARRAKSLKESWGERGHRSRFTSLTNWFVVICSWNGARAFSVG